MEKFKKLLDKKINERKWLACIFALVLCLVAAIMCLNYLIDPFLLYGVSHKYNYYYPGIDDRVEKANLIYYGKGESYDSVLLGSSRARGISQYDFENKKLFNFGVSAGHPFEYEYYLKLMKQKGHTLETIYLQIDFFGSIAPTNDKNSEQYQRLARAIEPLSDPFHRFEKLFTSSKQLINIPLMNLDLKSKGKFYYSRNNVFHWEKESEEMRKRLFRSGLKKHTLDFLEEKYVWNANLKEMLMRIKKSYPDSKFVVFTSPVSAPLFVSEINFAKRWKEYKEWLKLHIEAFGGIYQFGGLNEITQNLQNYPDDDHFYPEVGTMIAKTLTQKDFAPIKDFGIYLTLDNLEEYLIKLERELKSYDMTEVIEIMNDESIKVKQ